MVTAFTSVRDLADFSVEASGEIEGNESFLGDTSSTTLNTLKEETKLGPSDRDATRSAVNINIQLQLPSDASGEIYDKFFAALPL